MTILNQIKENAVYKQVLSDSFGGVMYDVANQGKYDTTEILPLMKELGESQMDGIMSGAYNFLSGK